MKYQHHGHAHHFMALTYPVSFRERIYSIVVGPLAVVALLALLFYFYPILEPTGSGMPLSEVFVAALYTLFRLVVAYFCAVVVAVPLAILVTHNSIMEKILLPVFDIMQSIPILAIFPVIIMLFVRFGNLNGAAIFILFLSMLWNMVFTLVGGLKLIPRDIVDAAHIFGLRGWSYLQRLVLPALVPQFVTGSILAVAQGWNITIVAEVLHTYIPGGTSAQDLFGVGSILVSAAANAQNTTFLSAVFVMVVIIAFFNFFVWQKLLHLAQRFRFE
ncbi:MAG: ABC transporter permease subunit [Candidatus Pacebacteria bacterium]|nr:ABC transporter permease subunit [Candidatus Paceibacterota bacterium]